MGGKCQKNHHTKNKTKQNKLNNNKPWLEKQLLKKITIGTYYLGYAALNLR